MKLTVHHVYFQIMSGLVKFCLKVLLLSNHILCRASVKASEMNLMLPPHSTSSKRSS